MERLQKVIAESGVASRRKAEELIRQGRVKVNGEVVTTQGIKVSGFDAIEVNGHALKKEEKEYVLLYKPRGVVTTTKDEKQRKTILDLIDTNKRLYPVGRLDYDTSGVLLLTNDGELTNLLIHPRNQVEKVYLAKITGLITGDAIKKLASGVEVDGEKTARAKVKLRRLDRKNNASYVEMTIHEGKNHQVKKMFEAVGYTVEKLKRERVAFLDLKGLKAGEYRYLTIKEVKKLYNEAQNGS